ncbi:MAG: GTP-binding protein [Lachnospiraceae bacterium]|nr:GTP-binding protein [Lachnospiraceae bacterium]
MTRIDVISGFLGAGKTTLIKKLLKEALDGSKTVLIENEFGEIGIDGGFLKEAGIEIKEMNSGCICCSLVGDFGTSLKEVISTYAPERILIEPSGVGKLSDVLKAVEDVAGEVEVQVNSAVAVVDASKCKMYRKNFGEFFSNQIAYAGTIILSRTDKVGQDKIKACVEMIREMNDKATIITTPIDQLDGVEILKTIEGADKLEDMMKEMLEEAHEHHHEHDEHCTCGCHDHEHHDHEHHDHEHHHHHEHDEHCTCGCHDHEHHDHEHHHHHEHDEHCTCGCHDHEHHHHHHGHHHDHHHADEVFTSWGMETPNTYSAEEIEQILEALDSGEYGMILRAKGMVPAEDGTWIYYDYVPQEHEVRVGKPEVTGKICVIGSKLNEDALAELFRK